MAETKLQAAQPDPGQYDLTSVVEEERKFLEKTSAPAGAPIGLAFSGGGIRSATFNLGMIQALAECRLLSKFHYLSTVSGGGYIGSWLSALIHRSGSGRVERIEAALAATSENLPERAAGANLEARELAKLAEQLKRMQETLEKNAMTMSETDRRNRERDFGEANREFQRKQREFREDLNQRRNEELSGILERANRVVRQIAETEKYDVILQEAVFASPRIDITDKVIRALDDTPPAKK